MEDGTAKISAYIAKAQPFAVPILETIRARVHANVPDVEETLKWGFPHFLYRGNIVCSMASFKTHASFGLWQGSEILGDAKIKDGMGHLGRLTSVADLPDDKTFAGWMKQAVHNIASGVRALRTKTASKLPRNFTLHADFSSALSAIPIAKENFEGFSPSCQREYAEWINDAKQDATRKRRIEQSLEWISEGKQRNWKYQR